MASAGIIQVLKLDGTGNIPVPVTEEMLRGNVGGAALTAATAPTKTRDVVAGANDVGTSILLIRRDAPTALTPVAGDYETPQINAYGAQWVQQMLTAGGCAVLHHLLLAATTNATLVKSSAAALSSIVLTNNNAAWAYLKLFNKASAPTVGTDTPVAVIGMPPTSVIQIPFPVGMAFGTGLSYAVTALPALLDTTAVLAQGTVLIAYA